MNPVMMRHPLPGLVAGASLLVLALAEAWAVLPAEYYERARKAAHYQLVITVTSVKPAGRAAGACAVTGTVRRVFRNDTDRPLDAGQAVAFSVNCLRRGASAPMGGLWIRWDALARASRLSGYFNLDQPAAGATRNAAVPLRLTVAADQVRPLADTDPEPGDPPGPAGTR